MQVEFPMNRRSDSSAAPGGTCFLVYPQSPVVVDYAKPEPVWIATEPGRLQPGPADHRMYVRDPVFSKQPYEYPYLPPYVGETHVPAVAGYDGHFDGIPLHSRQFVAAHAFACAARVLDIWESYLGHPITWHFSETYERLEIIPWVEWDNAQSGYGYLELGIDRASNDRAVPYALNFDVIAHEVGHAIVFSQAGFPLSGGGAEFGPIHEASSDLISLLSFLHFDTAMERLLRHCGGNLLVLNELNRIAELSGDRQIRIASNSRRLSEVSADVHDRSRPLCGAAFDTLVDRFHDLLVSQDLADERLLLLDVRGVGTDDLHRISEFTSRAYRDRPFLFKSALVQARDEVAKILAHTWKVTPADEFTFMGFSHGLLGTASSMPTSLFKSLEANLAWRELI